MPVGEGDGLAAPGREERESDERECASEKAI